MFWLAKEMWVQCKITKFIKSLPNRNHSFSWSNEINWILTATTTLKPKVKAFFHSKNVSITQILPVNLNLWTELHEWGTLKICVANISLFQLRFTGPEYNVTKSSLFWIYKCDEKPTNIFVKIETWIKPNILTKTKRQMRVVWSIVHCVCVCEREWVSVILNGRIWLYHHAAASKTHLKGDKNSDKNHICPS